MNHKHRQWIVLSIENKDSLGKVRVCSDPLEERDAEEIVRMRNELATEHFYWMTPVPESYGSEGRTTGCCGYKTGVPMRGLILAAKGKNTKFRIRLVLVDVVTSLQRLLLNQKLLDFQEAGLAEALLRVTQRALQEAKFNE